MCSYRSTDLSSERAEHNSSVALETRWLERFRHFHPEPDFTAALSVTLPCIRISGGLTSLLTGRCSVSAPYKHTTDTIGSAVPRLGLAVLVLLLISVTGARTLPTAPSLPPKPSGQYGLPFAAPPGPDTWLLGQFYGNTTFAYKQRATQYQYGQGLHFGLDFTAACGTPIVAITDGVVSEVDGPHGSPPHNLVIDHPDGLSSLYGHLLRKATVKVGQHVRRGEVVAVSGDSQLSCVSEPHLHLEIRDHSHLRLFNPVPYLNADWAALSLVDPDVDGPAFEQNLGLPGTWQFLEDQPPVRIGGALLNAHPRAWPPLAPATPALPGKR